MNDVNVPAGEFKAKCLQLIDRVAASGEAMTITKRGRPVARLVPLASGRPLFGALKGSVLKQDDLVSSLREPWEADR